MTTINPPATLAGSYRVGEKGGWLPANSPQSLRDQVHDNLRRLGLDVLDVVNLRTLAGSTTARRFRTLRASATDRGKRVGEGLGELART